MMWSKRCVLIVVLGIILLCESQRIFAVVRILEAENAELIGVYENNSLSGYSGTGYVAGFDADTDSLKYRFTIEGGLYKITIGYALPSGEKGYQLIVNNIISEGMLPAGNQNFMEISAGKFLLSSGYNTITLAKGWGWYYIDYIKIEEAVPLNLITPPSTLSDESTTDYTCKLFGYLREQYGSKVISGQQDLAEVNYVKQATGFSPAIGAFDLIDYSPSRIEYGANPEGDAESWIEWQTTGGGIVSLCWHWNAPTDLINETDKEWWRGFYTYATTFNLTQALSDTESENYQLLLRDIDSIAVQLKKFQDAEIPVLWRPLHEASGGWFWWGAYGAASFKTLWQLVYTRLTDLHQLHNLIWVYTSGDADWYPGDDYVDIIGLDIYTNATSPMSGEWENIQLQFNGKRLVALSESGTIPIPENIRSYGTYWSWFSIWSGEFIHGISSTVLNTVYSDFDIITLEELPDWETYVVGISNPGYDLKPGFCIFPNPASKTLYVRFQNKINPGYALKIFDIYGNTLVNIYDHTILNMYSTREINIENFKEGIYFISLFSNDQLLFTQKFIKK